MLTAYDLSSPVGNTGFAFGMDSERVAAMLVKLAEDIVNKRVLVKSVSTTHEAANDEWLGATLSLKLCEKRDASPGV